MRGREEEEMRKRDEKEKRMAEISAKTNMRKGRSNSLGHFALGLGETVGVRYSEQE